MHVRKEAFDIEYRTSEAVLIPNSVVIISISASELQCSSQMK